MTALFRLAHIGANEDSPAATVHDFLGNRMAALFVAARDRDSGALLAEEDRRGFADAGCAPGDESYSMFQSHAFNPIPPNLRRPPPALPRLYLRMLHPWRDTARRAISFAFQCDPADAWPIRREIDLLLLPIGFGDQKVIPRENGQLAKYRDFTHRRRVLG